MPRNRLLRCARNDDEIPNPATAVIPRAGGVSSTPRLIRSITAASGILDRPVKPDDDSECASAFSRRIAPEACWKLLIPRKREGAGNAGCLLHPRSRVQNGLEYAHEHTGTAGALRHSLRKEVNGRGKPSQINGVSTSCSILCHKPMQLRASQEILTHVKRCGEFSCPSLVTRRWPLLPAK